MIKTLNKNYKSRYFIIIFTLLLLSIKTFLLARLPTNVILFNGDTNSYLTYSENFGSLIFGANPPFAELGLIRTPGYPFFLLLLKFISLKELIFIQLVMGSAISLVTYKICKILFGERIAFLAFLFSAIEISLFYEEFYLLSDTLFAFVLVWAIYVAVIVDKRNLYNFKYALLVGLLIGISILIRPIGQVIIAAFIIFLLLHFRNLKMRNFFLVSLLAISVTISPLILRNWLVFDVVKVSSIDSVNLLYYEGANTLALTSKESLEVIQKREALLESSVLGDKPTIKEAVEYRQSRAINLIINNPFFWVESKVIGVGKLLLGISRVSSNKVLMGNGDDTEPSKFLDLSRFFALIVTIAMAIFGFIGFIRILVTRKDLGPQILLCFFAFLLLSSAGGNAYSRFRVPLNTPLAIFASIGLISIFKYIQSCFIKNNIITGFNSKFEKTSND